MAKFQCLGLQYTVKISAAKMPQSCWGRYVHIAVVAHVPGHIVRQIKDTRSQSVIERWENMHDGSTIRSQSERTLADAEDMAAEYRGECRNYTRQARRNGGREPSELDVRRRADSRCKSDPGQAQTVRGLIDRYAVKG